MTVYNEDYLKLVERTHKERMVLRSKKSKDYSGADVLSNFRRISSAATALGINVHTTSGYAMFMALMKLDRINNLSKKGTKPENESIKDSIMDLLNYTDLLHACLMDGK